jgi:hypothetical protein
MTKTKYCSRASYLVRPLQGSCLQQMAQKTKERGKKEKKPPAVSTSSYLTRRAAPFPTKPRIPSTNTRTGCQRSKSRAFTEQTKLFVVAYLFFSELLTLSSLFSNPYFYPLHVPSFSCGTIYCSPSQQLFLSLSIHTLPLSSPHPILSQPVTTLPLLPTHSPPAD